MLFKMICLSLDGIERNSEQLADEPHYDYDLTIEEWDGGDNVFGHNIRTTRFLDTKSAHGLEILPPLFDPFIVKMTSDQMLLLSCQVRRIDGGRTYGTVLIA